MASTATIKHTIDGTIDGHRFSRTATSETNILGHVMEVVDVTNTYAEVATLDGTPAPWKKVIIVNTGAEEVYVRVQVADPGDPHDFYAVPALAVLVLLNTNDGALVAFGSNINKIAIRSKTGTGSTCILHGIF